MPHMTPALVKGLMEQRPFLSMTDLDKKFGVDRIIDTPVSELACTGAAIGASLCGYRAIAIHPRMPEQ